MRKIADEQGQVIGFTVIALTAIIAMGAFVLDVGAWFRADRQMQSVADAAALAGAQRLPDDPSAAIALAKEYATKNGGPAPTAVTVSSTKASNDTIMVRMDDKAPGFLAAVFGIDSVKVGAQAKARAGLPGKVRWVAPIVVNEKHPKLNCGTGEFGHPKVCAGTANTTVLDYQHLKADGTPDGSGSFGFVDFTGEGNGTSDIKGQLRDGYSDSIAPGQFSARTGNPFSAITSEMDQHVAVGDELLFPIYRQLTGSGTSAQFQIIGFAAFVITGYSFTGNKEKIFGYFTGNVVWDGTEEESSGSSIDYGIRVISLTE